jgi:RNA polymerase sigma-70 factor (ECF subfamily)
MPRCARELEPTSVGCLPQAPACTFEAVYQRHFAFVWRNLRRLGIPEHALDDAAQEVFLVVHRRLVDFDSSVSMRSWLFGITYRIALALQRRLRHQRHQVPLWSGIPSSLPGPHQYAQQAEAVRFLEDFLASIDPAQRAVFILTKLEQMSAPEIATALGVKLNTVYSRLRAARAAFGAAIERRLRVMR